MEDNTLWCEKYRPKTVDDYIGNDHLVSKLKLYIETQDVPHLLLYGSAGTGKCLDFSEYIDIEIELTPDELIKLQKYLI